MLSKHQHSLSMKETFCIMPSLSLKYTNFTLDSWHLSVSLGRCLSPTWTEGKLLLRLSLWANWLSLRSGSLSVYKWYHLTSLSLFIIPSQITMTMANATLGYFTTCTHLWVNVSLLLTNTWKSLQAPWVHIIPCHDQGRTTPRPIYHKCTFYDKCILSPLVYSPI